MRGKAAEHVLERIPEYTHLHVDKYTQMILLINQVLKKNKELCQKKEVIPVS